MAAETNFIGIEIEFDMGRIEESMDAFARALGISARFVAYDQIRLWVNSLMTKFTHPRKAAAGRKKVTGDLYKLFSPVDKQFEQFLQERLLAGQEPLPAGTVIDFSGNQAAIKNRHMRYRNRRGNVRYKAVTMKTIGQVKITNQFYLRKRDFEKYRKEQVKKVGRLKAGWLPAADYYAGKAKAAPVSAAWIRKNAQREGSVQDAMDIDGSGFLMATNAVPYAAQKISQRDVDRSGTIRELDMARNVEKRADQLIARYFS